MTTETETTKGEREMKNIQGEKIETMNYYPVSNTFQISFDEEKKEFEIKTIEDEKEFKFFHTDKMDVEGALIAADNRGSETGKIRGMTEDAFELLQNSGKAIGNTYAIKEVLKGLGFSWNRDEKAWKKN